MPLNALKSRLSGRSPARADAPGQIETAVALVLAPGLQGAEALFIRRAVREGDPWSGQIGLPGGRREPGDADRLATAIRETSEEVGVELTADALIGPLDDLHPSASSLMPAIVISPYVFSLPQKPQTRLSSEVAGVLWAGLSDLPEREARTVVKVRGIETEVPCFLQGDAVIWGLTYRILKSLLELTTPAA